MAQQTETLNVEGMSCMHCVNAVKKSVGSLPGVSRVEVDLMGKKVAVDFESDQVTLDEIRTQIEDTGYEVV
ncbi:MAG TPA: copper chaperone CopZ [Syntrophomonadaceae bacterium]|nr:copper chaperone CopZ [Syntrophomonadaceae bacterium]